MCRYVKLFVHFTICVCFLKNIVGQTPTSAPRMDMEKVDPKVHCKFQPNSFDCFGNGTSSPRFYFDVQMGSCKTFYYGGCVYSFNTFSTLFHCSEKCFVDSHNANLTNLTNNVICRLQPEFGSCFGYQPMFYYDVSLRQCKGFSYSGCGGNNNRFPSSQICTAICTGQVEYVPYIPQEKSNPEATLK